MAAKDTGRGLLDALTAHMDAQEPWRIRASTQQGVKAGVLDAKANLSPRIPGAVLDSTGTRTIQLPPGDVTITEAFGLLGHEGMGQKVSSLRFVGAGKDQTRVIFDPADPADMVMARNDYWLGLWFEGITFVTKRAGATFMQSHTTHNAQAYTFTDVQWSGPWRHVFDLQGDNNNSEFLFIGCGTTHMQKGGAFLHIGAENTSDQFLNYWFYGFKHWSTSAALIDAAKGGHFHLFGVDASDWGRDLTEPGHLINLRGHTHGQGVLTMTATGLRVEAKNPLAGLIHSEWPFGNVTIQADWSSQTPFYKFGTIISIDVENTPGAVYDFHDSNLAGGVRIKYGGNAWENQHNIRFTRCEWRQRLTPSEVVSYVDPPANPIRPAVTFDGCRGDAQNPFSERGASVWDATVSHDAGALVKAGGPRTLTLRGIRGSITDTPLKVHLPTGAILTGLAPVASAGEWAAETSTGEPVTFPYRCGTREQATILVRETTGADTQPGGSLALTGHW